MDGFSPERLEKLQQRAGSECFLRSLRQGIRNNQRKITKSVYNLQSRNIKKFTKEWQQLQLKFRSAASDYPPVPALKPKGTRLSTMTYDEDQALEMSYEIPFAKKQTQNDSAPVRTQFSQQQLNSKGVKTVKTVKNRYSLKMGRAKPNLPTKPTGTREKSISQAKDSRREMRHRWITQWEPEVKESGRISLKKGESPPQVDQNLFADLSRERVDQYIRNLHRLEWSSMFLKQHPQVEAEESTQFKDHLRKFKCDLDCSLDEQAINYMISRRYNLLSTYLEDAYEQRSKQLAQYSPNFKSIQSQCKVSLLESLNHNSILKIIKTGVSGNPSFKNPPRTSNRRYEGNVKTAPTLYFSLPYCQFISYRETKSSVYQLINMGNKTALKLAFTIYDKNRNGVVDEDDLVQMISLSRTLTFLELDITTIAKAMMSSTENSKDKREDLISSPQGSSQRTQKHSVRASSLDRQSTISKKSRESKSKESVEPSIFMPIKEEDESEHDNQPGQLSSGRFKIEKLFTFLRGKDLQKYKQKHKNSIHILKPLTFDLFCRAFNNQRPMVILDLFQFLFGAPMDHFNTNIQKKFANLSSKRRISPQRPKEQATIDQKWSQRIKNVNIILQSFVSPKHPI